MTLDDLSIIVKKITVGVVIYLIPVFIIVGGLWLTSHFFKKKAPKPAPQHEAIKQ